MRIIAGKHRGRKLLPPYDERTTRPITDRVKETLFNKLNSLGVLGEGNICDVFCGTGSMGLEALSRGAGHCLFIERDRDAQKRLKQNLQTFDLESQSQINSGDGFTPLWVIPLKANSIKLVFLDPPYANMHDENYRQRLSVLLAALHGKMESGGIIVLRSHKDDPAIEPDFQHNRFANANHCDTTNDAPPCFTGPRTFTYGNMGVHLYQRPIDE